MSEEAATKTTWCLLSVVCDVCVCVGIDPHLLMDAGTHMCGGQRTVLGMVPQMSFVVAIIVLIVCFILICICTYTHIYVCVCICVMYMNVSMYTAWHTCGNQRATLGVGPCLLSDLRRASLLSSYCACWASWPLSLQGFFLS